MVVTVHPIELAASITNVAGSPAVFTDEVIGHAQKTLDLQEGFTPQTVRIEQDCLESDMSIQELRKDLAAGFSYEVRIIKPRDRLSTERIADHLAEYLEGKLPFFRRRSVEVHGEVTEKDNVINLVLTATFVGGKVYESTTIIRTESREILVKQAGIELLRFAAPWLYASTAAFGDRRNGRQALEILSNEFPSSDRSLVLAMKGFTYLYSNVVGTADDNVEFADKSFKEALIVNSRSYWALVGRARTSLKLFTKGRPGPRTATQWGYWNEAEANITKAIQEDAGNPEAYSIMYVLYVVKGELPKAAEQREFLIKHAKKRQQYVRAVEGIIVLTLGGPDGLKEAIKDLQVLMAEPGITDNLERASLLRSRGRVAAKKGDLGEFEHIAVEAYQNRDGCLLVDLAKLALKTSDEQAVGVVRDAWLKRSNTDHEYAGASGAKGFHFYNNWGRVNEELGAYERAIQMYRKALEFYGDESWALSNWGNTLYRQGKFREADIKYKEAMAAGKTRASAQGLINSRLTQSLRLTDPALRKEALTALLVMFAKLELEWSQLTPGSCAAASIANCLLGNEEGAIAYRDKMKKSGTEHDMPSVDGVEECIKSLNTRRIPSASNHAEGQNPRRPRVLHGAQVSPLPI